MGSDRKVKRPQGDFSRRQLVFLGVGALALLGFSWVWLLCEPEHHWGLLSGFCFLGGAAIGHAWALGLHHHFVPTAAEVVHLLQLQRHAFLNHLQVISALAQLNKPEHICEYITSTNKDLDRERCLTGLLPAEAGLVLLDWCYRLHDAGVAVQVDLKTDLSRLANGTGLAALLMEALTALIGAGSAVKEVALKSFSEDGDEVLELTLVFDGNLPWPRPARLRERARTVPAEVKVKRQENTLTLAILLTPVHVPAAPKVGAAKS
ncbi:MAG: hypothetical protein PWR31_1067 [Bacillota bacterium]|jgi:hypothetical protein|nr:hypothetical protein [Bacillota bacterium]MDK2927377.1 hypothetical protein [Bacillota bacterium]